MRCRGARALPPDPRKIHQNQLLLRPDIDANRLHERDQHPAAVDLEQRRAAILLEIRHPPDHAARIALTHLAANQVGMKILARFELHALRKRHPHFSAAQFLRVGNGIDAAKLEDQGARVIPHFLDLVGGANAPSPASCTCRQSRKSFRFARKRGGRQFTAIAAGTAQNRNRYPVWLTTQEFPA